MNFVARASALAVAACLAAPAQADFSFSPRFFLYFDNAYQASSRFHNRASPPRGPDAARGWAAGSSSTN